MRRETCLKKWRKRCQCKHFEKIQGRSWRNVRKECKKNDKICNKKTQQKKIVLKIHKSKVRLAI